MSSEQTVPMNYVPGTPWHRRGKVRRYAVPAALAGLILFSGWRWGPWAWGRARLLWAQRQCMTYAVAPGHLVYATDPEPDPFARSEDKAHQAPAPACWLEMQRAVPPATALPPQASPGLDSPFGPMAPAPVFLHARSAGGETRLLAVEFGRQMLGGKANRVLCCRVIAPATWRGDPQVLWEGTTIVASSFEWTAPVRVFAGRADPADPSRFTIDVEVNGQKRPVKGRLRGDDTVELQP